MAVDETSVPDGVLRARATGGPGDRSPFAIGLILRRAHLRAAEASARVLRPLGLELRHFAVLVALNADGPLSQSRLVEITGSDKASMVRTIDDLERRSIVERCPLPGDRRVRRVSMTAVGLSVFDEAHRRGAPVMEALEYRLDRSERALLLELLTCFAFPSTDRLSE